MYIFCESIAMIFLGMVSLRPSVTSRYVAANLDGVHAGCALVDRALSAVDQTLFNYLESKFLSAQLYAFPLVMSLHACIPPLEEVVKLWDSMFSFGVHLEVLICVAQVGFFFVPNM